MTGSTTTPPSSMPVLILCRLLLLSYYSSVAKRPPRVDQGSTTCLCFSALDPLGQTSKQDAGQVEHIIMIRNNHKPSRPAREQLEATEILYRGTGSWCGTKVVVPRTLRDLSEHNRDLKGNGVVAGRTRSRTTPSFKSGGGFGFFPAGTSSVAPAWSKNLVLPPPPPPTRSIQQYSIANLYLLIICRWIREDGGVQAVCSDFCLKTGTTTGSRLTPKPGLTGRTSAHHM